MAGMAEAGDGTGARTLARALARTRARAGAPAGAGPDAGDGDAWPLVAVPADIRAFQGYDWHCSPQQYVRALHEVSRVTPVIVPALPGMDVGAVLAAVDGVLVSGSRTNVHPALFGADPTPAHEPYDERRDALTLPLIRHAVGQAVPTFCICRGIQEMNVAFGGTLATEIQEREGIDDHRMAPSDDPDRRFAIRHPVSVEADGPLAPVLGEGVRVNSLHRQAIERLAPSLRVEARAPDGTIEAVSVTGAPAFAVGVQWHPEYWAGTDGPSTALFEAFGDAVRAHAAARRTAVAGPAS